jgi:hypothetical protein
LRIDFTITYADGTAAEATASVADQVAFEQAHDRSIARLADDFRLNAHWLIVHLAYEFGLAPSVVAAESDRMIFTMSKYLTWRANESRRS